MLLVVYQLTGFDRERQAFINPFLCIKRSTLLSLLELFTDVQVTMSSDS